MAKRKKNAGQGYGMMFHGAFGSKADAKKKERQVHGFIQPRNIKGERRFVVMSERKNPIRRKRRNAERFVYAATDGTGVRKTNWSGVKDYHKDIAKNHGGKLLEMNVDTGKERVVKDYGRTRKKLTYAPNPSELVVLGANPHGAAAPQEIVLEPGKNYLIRTNPSAEGLREDFTGTPVRGSTVYDVEGIPKGDYAQLGELLSLYVKPVIGGQVREIRFNRPHPLLISDSSARQLYFVNGDQDMTDKLEFFNSAIPGVGMVELGEVRRIDYKQRKAHVPDPDIDEWKHNFGEESGVRPTLWFDPRTRQLFLKGGEYTVRREGIVN